MSPNLVSSLDGCLAQGFGGDTGGEEGWVIDWKTWYEGSIFFGRGLLIHFLTPEWLALGGLYVKTRNIKNLNKRNMARASASCLALVLKFRTSSIFTKHKLVHAGNIPLKARRSIKCQGHHSNEENLSMKIIPVFVNLSREYFVMHRVA